MASVEVMTACENVCRDFGWLGSFPDWGPTLLASATALIIAFCAYPWQKKRDRELQIELEQRVVYSELVSSVYVLAKRIREVRPSNPEEVSADIQVCAIEMRELEGVLMRASILADADVANRVVECLEQAYGLLRRIKADLQGILDASENGIGARDFKVAVEKAKYGALEEFYEILSRLVNVIREKAYKQQGELKLRSRFENADE